MTSGATIMPEAEAEDRSAQLMRGVLAPQPYLLAYSGIISVVSPALTGWQLMRVCSHPASFGSLARIGLAALVAPELPERLRAAAR